MLAYNIMSNFKLILKILHMLGTLIKITIFIILGYSFYFVTLLNLTINLRPLKSNLIAFTNSFSFFISSTYSFLQFICLILLILVIILTICENVVSAPLLVQANKET